MAYIENGVVYAGKYQEGSSRKRLREATDADYANSSIKKISAPIGKTLKGAASSAASAIGSLFSSDAKKKKKDSLMSKIGFDKGGLATKGFKTCKNCGSPANCSTVKRCQNRGK